MIELGISKRYKILTKEMDEDEVYHQRDRSNRESNHTSNQVYKTEEWQESFERKMTAKLNKIVIEQLEKAMSVEFRRFDERISFMEEKHTGFQQVKKKQILASGVLHLNI